MDSFGRMKVKTYWVYLNSTFHRQANKVCLRIECARAQRDFEYLKQEGTCSLCWRRDSEVEESQRMCEIANFEPEILAEVGQR